MSTFFGQSIRVPSRPRKVSLLGLRFRGRRPWAQPNRIRRPRGSGARGGKGGRCWEHCCNIAVRGRWGAGGLRRPRRYAGYRGGSISMHRRGGSGVERLQGCAGDLQLLRVVFGRASGAPVGLSEGHFGSPGSSIWSLRGPFGSFRECFVVL